MDWEEKEFLTGNEILSFYESLRYGDKIQITRDLSLGKKEKDMIQTLAVQVLPDNYKHIKPLLTMYPVLKLEVDTIFRF